MKAKIAAIFLLLTSLAGSNQNPTNDLVWEYGLILWEREIVRGIGLNQTYAQMLPSHAAYFQGKAAAYAELLERLHEQN